MLRSDLYVFPGLKHQILHFDFSRKLNNVHNFNFIFTFHLQFHYNITFRQHNISYIVFTFRSFHRMPKKWRKNFSLMAALVCLIIVFLNAVASTDMNIFILWQYKRIQIWLKSNLIDQSCLPNPFVRSCNDDTLNALWVNLLASTALLSIGSFPYIKADSFWLQFKPITSHVIHHRNKEETACSLCSFSKVGTLFFSSG